MARKLKWRLNQTIEAGHRSVELVGVYRAEVESRLPAGLYDGVVADLALLEGRVADAIRAPSQLKTLTKDQNAATAAGHALVTAVRGTVVSAGATAAQAKAFGVGMKMAKRSVSQVAAGLDAIIAAAGRYPELARRAGVLESDLVAARAMRAAVASADGVQERGKETRKLTTAARNEVAIRVEDAVSSVSAIGQLHFFERPEIARQFADLVPSRSARRAPAPTPT